MFTLYHTLKKKTVPYIDLYMNERELGTESNWETLKDSFRVYLLLIFIPPGTGLGGCLLPSANEVVLGRPLISLVATIETFLNWKYFLYM